MKESNKKRRKINIVDRLKGDLEGAGALVVVDYTGLSADEINTLRQKIKKLGNRMIAVKKRLLKRALSANEQYHQLSEQHFDGQAALITLTKKPLETIKLIRQYSNQHGKPSFSGGFFDHKIISKDDFLTLADIPPREELLGNAVSLINNPIVRLISGLRTAENKLVLILRMRYGTGANTA